MTLLRNALLSVVLAVPRFARAHRCGFGCGAKAHSLIALERHYFYDHAGDRMTLPKGHVRNG